MGCSPLACDREQAPHMRRLFREGATLRAVIDALERRLSPCFVYAAPNTAMTSLAGAPLLPHSEEKSERARPCAP